jgi:hypothetical protein
MLVIFEIILKSKSLLIQKNIYTEVKSVFKRKIFFFIRNFSTVF